MQPTKKRVRKRYSAAPFDRRSVGRLSFSAKVPAENYSVRNYPARSNRLPTPVTCCTSKKPLRVAQCGFDSRDGYRTAHKKATYRMIRQVACSGGGRVPKYGRCASQLWGVNVLRRPATFLCPYESEEYRGVGTLARRQQ